MEPTNKQLHEMIIKIGTHLMRLNKDIIVLYEGEHAMTRMLSSRLVVLTPDERKVLTDAIAKCESSVEHYEAELATLASDLEKMKKP
jgi:hypothetical protein